MRVLQFLAEQQINYEPIVHPPAYTAQKRAKYMGISGKQVAKALLMAGPDGYFLAVLSATCHVDTQALAAQLGGPVRLAADEEIGEVFEDCEWGVVAPFGRLYGVPTILDDALAPDSWIVFEAHTHAEAIRMRCADFEQLEQPRRLRFASPCVPNNQSFQARRGPLGRNLRKLVRSDKPT
jgi:Ala-tRNA(Pro) deacylase